METRTSNQLKDLVKEEYGKIAEQSKDENEKGCCGSGCCNSDSAVMAEDYSNLIGYVSEADLGLGCGLPTEFAQIKEGDTVVDLGSGAGNDSFIARSVTGSKGKVIGIDFTDKMIAKARLNAEKLGYSNVEFVQGDIENIPLPANTAEIVVSNCVLNLVPDKDKAFRETFRILKPGGHFSVSDIVVDGTLPEQLLRAAEMYAGCVSGAIQKDEYLSIVEKAGFKEIAVQKEKEIRLPDDILKNYFSEAEISDYRKSGSRIISLTLYGEKPAEKKNCCGPECCS